MSPLPLPTCSSKRGEVTLRGEVGDLDTSKKAWRKRQADQGRLWHKEGCSPSGLVRCDLLLSRFCHHSVSVLHKVHESLNHGGEKGGRLPTCNTSLHTDRHPEAYYAAKKVILLGPILLSYKMVQIHSEGGNTYLEILL